MLDDRELINCDQNAEWFAIVPEWQLFRDIAKKTNPSNVLAYWFGKLASPPASLPVDASWRGGPVYLQFRQVGRQIASKSESRRPAISKSTN